MYQAYGDHDLQVFMKPLEADLRKLLHPNTAQRLKVRQASSSLHARVLLTHSVSLFGFLRVSWPWNCATTRGSCSRHVRA